MDITQIVIIISLLAITTVIVIAGIYVISILKDVKKVTGIVSTVSNLFEAVGKFINKLKDFEKPHRSSEPKEPHSTPKSFFKAKK
jgi:hypothetical protein